MRRRFPPLGARVCDRLLFPAQQRVAGAIGARRDGFSGRSATSGGQGKEDPTTLRERVHWAALGLGCTWFINDTMFLQLPFWESSQKEGLALGGNIALTASIAGPIAALIAVCLRSYCYDTLQKAVIPVLISFSLCAGAILALGLWRTSSGFIYCAVALASTVGSLTPYATIPWVMSSHFKPALISPLFLGGSLGSLSAATLSILQAPGGACRFSPSIFFAICTVPILCSFLAFVQIMTHGIGINGIGIKRETKTVVAAAPSALDRQRAHDLINTAPEVKLTDQARVANNCTKLWDRWLPDRWRVWLPTTWALACWIGVITMCTWSVSRAVMGYAAAHTVPGHHLCRNRVGGCAKFCGSLADHATCLGTPGCVPTDGSAHVCREDKGERVIGWITSLAQWAYTAGISLTIALPSFRLWSISILWFAGFALMVWPAVTIHSSLFEREWGKALVLVSALLVRGVDGYLETMVWRYIAHRYGPRDEQAVTLFFGIVAMLVNLAGSSIAEALIHVGVIAD